MIGMKDRTELAGQVHVNDGGVRFLKLELWGKLNVSDINKSLTIVWFKLSHESEYAFFSAWQPATDW